MKATHVIVVDDDQGVLDSLVSMLTIGGHRVTGFSSAMAFLGEARTLSASCLITDIRLPGIDGLTLMKRLAEVGHEHLPVIVVSGHADVPIAVSAMQLGAMTVLEKPFPPARLLEVVQAAHSISEAEQTEASPEVDATLRCYATLTARQREIMLHLVQGSSSKVAAKSLGLSPRTVDVFRAKILHKMNASNVAALATRLAHAGLLVL
jgi:two-component system, LuxR family, response regulator FixJ